MAHNCLVTKLKETVNNPRLPKVNELIFPFRARKTDTEKSNLTMGANSIAYIYNDSNVLVSSFTNQILSNFSPDYSGYIKIVDKLNNTKFGFPSFFDLSGVSKFDFSSLRTLSVANTNFRLKLEDILTIMDSEYSSCSFDGNNTQVSGNLEVLLDANDNLIVPFETFRVPNCKNISAKRSTITKLSSKITYFSYTGINIIEGE